ncbi:MAG: glycosyltransferase family 4 protein, partial [Candidatus Zixiibacteriota bacterium]
MPTIAERLAGVRVLLVAPSLAIMGGQAVQADLLLKNWRAENVQVGFQPHNPAPWWPLSYLTRIKYVRTAIVSVFYIAGLFLRAPRYDVIHIFSASYRSFILAPTPAILAAKLFGKKCILNYRSGEADDHLTRSGKRIFWIIRKADRIIVPSGYLVDVFGKHGFKAESISNIADLTMFRFRERKANGCKIIVARNLEPLYDIETAIRAFAIFKASHPEATLKIIGKGSDERRLKKLVNDENITGITFTGRVERAEIAKLYDEADIFLNTSIIDNMPVAIVEAFHAGLPIVTTNAGGIPYIVRDRENGLLVDMKNIEAVAQALNEVCEDVPLRAKLI